MTQAAVFEGHRSRTAIPDNIPGSVAADAVLRLLTHERD